MTADCVALSQLFRIGSSKRVLKSQWKSEGVPFYRGREISRLSFDGFVENELFISEAHYAELAEKYGAPVPGDIMITAIGTIGNSYVVRDSDRFYFKDASVLWMSRTSEVNSDFVNLWLKSPQFLTQLEAGNGATVDTLTIQKLQNVKIKVPSTKEQIRIVALLDEAFAGIATAKANAEQNLRNAGEVFDTALAGLFGGTHDGWSKTTIGNCIEFIDYRGKTPVKTESGLRLITAKNVKMGYLQREPEEFVAPDSYDAWMTRGIPAKGDVLFTTEAPCGNVAQLDTNEKVVFAQRVIIMQPDANRLDSTFLKYALLSPSVQKRIQAKATGATALGIKASLLRTIEIAFPGLEEQRRAVAKFDALRGEVAHLQSLYTRKLAALDELKQSLLQRAFSGQLI